MKIQVFSKVKKTLLTATQSNPLSVELCPLSELKKNSLQKDTIPYLDVSDLSEEEIKKSLKLINSVTNYGVWGVIDPNGIIKDPARLFFDGASDYMGPALCKEGMDRCRLKALLSWVEARQNASTGNNKKPINLAEIEDCIAESDKPGNAFPGWKAIKPGNIYNFYFFYVSVSAHTNLKSRLGEKAYKIFMDKFRMLLQQSFLESDCILWMETDSNALYLVPPKKQNATSIIVIALRILLSAPLLAYEKLHIPFPVKFTFALHYGQSEYAIPGKTGTIISDAINYIHHLGAKKAEPERLSISEEAAHLLEDKRLGQFFAEAGVFEKQRIFHSKKFMYK